VTLLIAHVNNQNFVSKTTLFLKNFINHLIYFVNSIKLYKLLISEHCKFRN
jgi:hypothetical protein